MGDAGDDMKTAIGYDTQMSQVGQQAYSGRLTAEGVSKVGPVSVKEMQTAKDVIDKSRAAAPPTAKRLASTGKRVFVMRHGERLDRLFPSWATLAFNTMGEYKPFDLNMPLQLPARSNLHRAMQSDPPLTEVGFVTSQMVGRAFSLTGVKISHVYSSPALRCLHSAKALLKTACPGQPAMRIKVEPGLFEFLGWYKDGCPQFMTGAELNNMRCPADPAYTPIVPASALLPLAGQETTAQYYERSEKVIKGIVEKCPEKSGIVIVGHAPSLDALPRHLLGKKKLPEGDEMQRMGLRYPYCSAAIVEETVENTWQLASTALPPISYMHYTNRIDFEYFNRD